MREPGELLASTERVLETFVGVCRETFGDDLVSLTLYGSAAEGRLRETSDVNLLVVLQRFDLTRADAIREPLRGAHAAIELRVMLLLSSELPEAAIVFADKLADMQRRRRVLHGQDVLGDLQLRRRDQLERLRQGLLNFVLRARQRYLLSSLRDEQAALALADLAGPLRAFAAEYRALAGLPSASPKAALEALLDELPEHAPLAASLSAARERRLGPGQASPALVSVIAVADVLRARVVALPEDAT